MNRNNSPEGVHIITQNRRFFSAEAEDPLIVENFNKSMANDYVCTTKRNASSNGYTIYGTRKPGSSTIIKDMLTVLGGGALIIVLFAILYTFKFF